MEAKAAKVEEMSEEELLELKTGGGEKYDQDKTMQQILEDAAEQLGMTADVYNNYECGRTLLKVNHMMGIFNLFGIELIAVV